MKITDQNDQVQEIENIWKLTASDKDQDDREVEEDESEDGAGDWGEVDPDGGPAPSAPGSAV